jgi:hypothetical protein
MCDFKRMFTPSGTAGRNQQIAAAAQQAKGVAPAPAPEAPNALSMQDSPENQDGATAAERARRKGRNALRIPLSMGGAGGGSGLNIPKG